MTTIKLTRPEDVSTFEVGERATISDFDYATACTIFGKPLVDAYYEWQENPPKGPSGTCTVTGIDRGAGVITFDVPRTTSDQTGRVSISAKPEKDPP